MEIRPKGMRPFHFGTLFFAIFLISSALSFAQTNIPEKNPNDDLVQRMQNMYSPVEKSNARNVIITPESLSSNKPAKKTGTSDEPLMCLTPYEMKVKIQSSFTTNRQIRSVVTYFVEVREGNPVLNIPLYPLPNEKAAPIGELHSGDIIKIEDSSGDYIEKLKADRNGQTIWRKAVVKVGDNQERQLWFRYNWRTLYTLTSLDQPFEMTMRIPKNMASQPLYRDAGLWTPRDCTYDPTVCVTQIGPTSRVYLLDTQFKRVEVSYRNSEWYSVFYKLGVDTIDDNLKRSQTNGWASSGQAFRRIDQVPAYLFMAGEPRFEDFLPEDEIRKNESNLFLLSKNGMDPVRRQRMLASLGLSESKMKGLSSIFDLSLQYETRLGLNHIELDQTFAGPKYTQEAVKVGIFGSSNLFVDVEIRGGLDISVTAASNNSTIGTSYLIDTQEWLVYTSPWSLNETPIKFGVGAYYMSMISNQTIGGFRGFVSAQAQVLFEDDRFGLGFRFAPVGQDFNLKFENRLLGVKLIYKMDWKRHDRPVEMTADYTDLYYKSPSTNETKLNSMGIGLSLPIDF
jgi:hypothetical protein